MSKEEARKRYLERKEAKIERFEELAAKHKARSKERAKTSSEMASCIPMGQPIHVGHHSEKSDRSFRARIDSNMRKSVEHDNASEHFKTRAEKLKKNKFIYADDPDAIDKLGEKVESLEQLASFMKAVNLHFKKTGKLDGLNLSPAWIQKITSTMAVWRGGPPFPAYEFTNVRGRVKNAKRRTEALKKAESFEPFEHAGVGVNLVDGQIQVDFGYKPDEATRTKLKSSPLVLKWSGYSKKWVRKFTGQGTYFFEELKKVIDLSTQE